jgi:TRAP-type C4-dicarboxylate transport system permease small subunit
MHVFEKLIKGLGFLNRVMLKGGGFIAMVMVGLMTVIILVAVFWRYVLQDSIFWSEELSKMLMVWMTFMAAPIALERGMHVGIQSLLQAVKGRWHYAMVALGQIVILILMAVCVKEGFELAWFAKRQVASSFDMSMIWPYLSMPIGCFMLFTVSLENMLNALKWTIYPHSSVAAAERSEMPLAPTL